MHILRYLFHPNPGMVGYGTPSMVLLLVVGLGLIALSIGLRFWRKGLQNPITRKLSRSWAGATLWFGITAAILVVARVEGIQFLAMRCMWLVWGIAAAVYVFFQYRLFTRRHYEVLPRIAVNDPRDRYIPGKKKH